MLMLPIIVAAIIMCSIWSYRRWRTKLIGKLYSQVSQADTPLGIISYRRIGEGQPIIALHGSPGGYDFIDVLDYLAEEGFQVIVPSRPGYLGTALSVGRSPQQQADAIIALMDSLEIKSALLLGFSGGGPIGLQCALRHPDRFQALGLNCAITGKYDPSDDLESSLFGKLFFINGVADVTYALLSILLHRFPKVMLKEVLKLVTTYEDKSQLDILIRQIFDDPRQARMSKILSDNAVPYDLRKIGFENDMEYYRQESHFPFEQLRVPTQIIHSCVDGDVNYEAHAVPASQRIPGAELITINGAGHLVWLGDEGHQAIQHQIAFLKQPTQHYAKSS